MAEIQFLPDEAVSRVCLPSSRTTATCLVVGVGLTVSSYCWTISSIVRALASPEPGDTAGISVAVAVGFIIGSVGFGALADRHGRRVISSIAGVVCVGGLGGAAAGGAGSLLGFHGVRALCAELAVWYFLLGIGIGGEFTVAAAYIVECFSINVAGSARALAGGYACMAVGRLLAPLIVAAGLGLQMSTEATLRFGLAFVALLSAGSFLCRFCSSRETPLFLNQHSTVGASALKKVGISLVFRCPKALGRALLGTCLASFLQGLASGGLLLEVIDSSFLRRSTQLDEAVSEQLLAVLMSFPGYLAAFALAQRGRKLWQLAGFGAMSVGFVGLAAALCTSHKGIQTSLYSMLLALAAGGPGATTFFVPAEVFPTCVRASCMGLTLAAGSFGWLLAMTGLRAVSDGAGAFVAMLMCAVVCGAGVISTALLTPRYNKETLRALAQIGPGKDKRESTVEALENGCQFRQCPNCEVMVERSGGCNVITCMNCQDVWCFACGGRGCTAWACGGIEDDTCTTLEALPHLLWPRPGLSQAD